MEEPGLVVVRAAATGIEPSCEIGRSPGLPAPRLAQPLAMVFEARRTSCDPTHRRPSPKGVSRPPPACPTRGSTPRAAGRVLAAVSMVYRRAQATATSRSLPPPSAPAPGHAKACRTKLAAAVSPDGRAQRALDSGPRPHGNARGSQTRSRADLRRGRGLPRPPCGCFLGSLRAPHGRAALIAGREHVRATTMAGVERAGVKRVVTDVVYAVAIEER